MSVASYTLEHFYYGQVVRDGKPQGELRLLALSAGVKSEHFSEIVSAARILPVRGNPMLSVALVRGGKQTPYVLVQSQVGDQGQVICHYIVLPVELLRGLGGNLTALNVLLEQKMPTFERTDSTLPKLTLPPYEPPSSSAQQDSMLKLMTATRDRMDVIEAMLASVIIGVPVLIKSAPADYAQRLGLVEGLLALLPHPARFGVTFALHVNNATIASAQVKFITDDTPIPENSLVYQWGALKAEGAKPENEYARFIRSQLRLDTELVVQQTNTLTPVAAWRIRRGENLADALKYASYRLTIDNAVTNALPIEAKEAARVLGEDPTLTDEMRLNYVRHLLAFIMATDEAENADLLVVVRGNAPLEQSILDQLGELAASGKSLRVYRALVRWLAHPSGFRGMYWIEMAHRAALTYAQSLVRTRDTKAMNLFLHQVREASNVIEARLIVPRLLEIALPLAASDPTLAQTAMVLGASSLPADHWQRFVSLKPLLAQLPRSLSRLIAYLNSEVTTPATPGLMAQAALEFGASWRALMLIRLAEMALHMGRLDAFDTQALAGLAQAAVTSWGEAHDGVLRHLVHQFSDDTALSRLSDDAPRYLLQILLSRRAYSELAAELNRHGRVLYPSGKQLEYAAMVRTLFAGTPILPGNVPEALSTLAAQGVRALPLVMAHFGALQQHQWSPALKPIANQLTALMLEHRLVTEAVPIDLLLELLRFHCSQQDVKSAVSVASLMAMPAARMGEQGIAPMTEMYRALQWNNNRDSQVEAAEEARKGGLENLRRFIRACDEATARIATNQLGTLGEPILEALKATYIVRRLLGGENIADYAYALHTTANFLQDTGSAFADRSRLPLLNTLIGDLDALSGGLSDADRKIIADSLLDIIKFIGGLAQQHRSNRPKDNDETIQSLLDARTPAQSVLDMFRVMSGYFGRGQRIFVKLERGIDNHPLGDRTATALLRELQIIARLLKNALLTFPFSGRISVEPAALNGEIESLWGDIPLHERRELVADLTLDLQRISEMILLITNKIEVKTLLESNGTTKKLDSQRQRPENTLEFYRFVHGYFRGRTRS